MTTILIALLAGVALFDLALRAWRRTTELNDMIDDDLDFLRCVGGGEK